jgi:hypothetical protein
MKADNEQKMYNLQEKFKIDLQNTKRRYEETLVKSMTVKDEEPVTLKQNWQTKTTHELLKCINCKRKSNHWKMNK